MDVITIIIYFLLFCALLGSVLCTVVGLPGNWFLLALVVIYAFITDFTVLSVVMTSWLVGAILAGELVESVAAYWGAKKEKGSVYTMVSAVVGGVLGAMAGTAILPVIGSLAGAAIGVFAATYAMEYYVTGDVKKAERVAKGAVMGQLTGMIAKLCIAVVVAFTMFYYILKSFF